MGLIIEDLPSTDPGGGADWDAVFGGGCHKVKFENCDFDVVRNAIQINSAAGCFVDFGIVSTQGYVNEMQDFYGAAIPRPVTVVGHTYIAGNNSQINFQSYQHSNAYQSGIFVTGTNNRVSVGFSNGRSWDVQGVGAAGFGVDTSHGSSLRVVDPYSSFNPGSGAPLLGANVKTVTFA